jgi:hypothetical protein
MFKETPEYGDNTPHSTKVFTLDLFTLSRLYCICSRFPEFTILNLSTKSETNSNDRNPNDLKENFRK